MKLNSNYLFRKIANEGVIIPTGQNVVLKKAIMKPNNVASFIVENLQNDITYEELLDKFIDKYEFLEDEYSIAENDLKKFIIDISNNDIIDLNDDEKNKLGIVLV